jgi:alpha/beta superfamily hydrolase
MIGIVCHPHSLFGGSLHNKVAFTMSRAFYLSGLMSLRFNFRGVGKSAGAFDHGAGETEDLLWLCEKIQHIYPDHRIALTGFSFGSYVAFCAASHWKNVAMLWSIAPPVVNFIFEDVNAAKIHCPWTIVQGENDEVVDPQAVWNWIARLEKQLPVPPTIIRFPETGHFFHGQLVSLRECLKNNVKQYC